MLKNANQLRKKINYYAVLKNQLHNNCAILKNPLRNVKKLITAQHYANQLRNTQKIINYCALFFMSGGAVNV